MSMAGASTKTLCAAGNYSKFGRDSEFRCKRGKPGLQAGEGGRMPGQALSTIRFALDLLGIGRENR
jgi:hypothetical protein